MYKNCQGYLKGELPVLKPDIIVTQATRLRMKSSVIAKTG